jgi:16S rRNA (adenine1518-N6/adenine1519-N6)-dimethyltransferase
MKFPGKGAELRDVVPEQFLGFVKRCFAQKRKTVANNLKPLASAEQVRELLRQLNLREDARAEQLDVSELAKLYEALPKPNLQNAQ